MKLAEAHVSVVQESDSKVNSSAAIVDERGKAAKQFRNCTFYNAG